MKITVSPIVFVLTIAVFGIVLIALTEKPIKGNAATIGVVENTPHSIAGHSPNGTPSNTSPAIPPFIVQDTINDSPGTNIVTRIVTFTAQVSGSPPLSLQWKVNKGTGFIAIPGATNTTYRISNAQVEHNGSYALFVTNSAGETNTSPQSLFVIEGED